MSGEWSVCVDREDRDNVRVVLSKRDEEGVERTETVLFRRTADVMGRGSPFDVALVYEGKVLCVDVMNVFGHVLSHFMAVDHGKPGAERFAMVVCECGQVCSQWDKECPVCKARLRPIPRPYVAP